MMSCLKVKKLIVLLWFFIILLPTSWVYAQKEKQSYFIQDTIQIIPPKLLGNHPLGMYLMRLESDFRIRPVKKKRLSIQLSSANVWEPLVTAYKPLEESDRAFLNSIIWYDREYAIDYNSIPADKISLQADAVIKGLHLSYYLPLGKQQEFRFDLRSYLITKGKFPFSVFSSDEVLEFFHSNIAGGEDPFARKYYGLDKAEIRYIDEEGRTIEKHANDFVLSGLEMHYTYFIPSEFLAAQDFYINLGTHLGINTNSYNSSSDIGISIAFIKQLKLKNNKILQLASGSSITIPSCLKWREEVNINNTTFIFTADWQLSYQARTKKNNLWEIALNYHHQSSYQSLKDVEGIILMGERISSHWHYAISHLYDSLTVWNIVFNYATSKYTVSVYFSEDIKVNNAPDIQTGVQLSFPF